MSNSIVEYDNKNLIDTKYGVMQVLVLAFGGMFFIATLAISLAGRMAVITPIIALTMTLAGWWLLIRLRMNEKISSMTIDDTGIIIRKRQEEITIIWDIIDDVTTILKTGYPYGPELRVQITCRKMAGEPVFVVAPRLGVNASIIREVIVARRKYRQVDA